MGKIKLIILLAACCATTAMAQHKENVHGVYTYEVGENEHTSVAEIKNRCITGARNNAIKEKFHEQVTSTTTIMDSNVNGKAFSRFIEDMDAHSNGEWLGDTKAPVITADYEDGKLSFSAEVWGEAREIKQPSYDIKWKILKGGKRDENESYQFSDGDRFFVKFRSPVSGYLALYVIDSAKREANCWLPYNEDPSGQFRVEAGKDYLLFDPASDKKASSYEMGTDYAELDNVVLIFSRNAFTKCNDYKSKNGVNVVPDEEFENWLRKMRKADEKMMIDRTKYISIVNENVIR